MSDYDAVLHRLEAEDAEKHERVRQMLYAEGRPDLVAELDAKVRDIRNGTEMARNCWHSISDAQRHALTFASRCRAGRITRSRGHYVEPAGVRPKRKIVVQTIRNLCARELMAWDGGPFDPEAAAVITERGLFVLKHGPQRQ